MLSTGVSLPVTSKTMSTAHQTPNPPSVSNLPTPVGMWPSANLLHSSYILQLNCCENEDFVIRYFCTHLE